MMYKRLQKEAQNTATHESSQRADLPNTATSMPKDSKVWHTVDKCYFPLIE
jgi:hypothetical protein